MSRTIAIANAKGGVGKTTSTMNLAAALVERKRRILAVDLDPQASLTLLLGFEAFGQSKTIYHALTSEAVPLRSIVHPTPEGFDLVPASHELNQAVDALEGNSSRTVGLRAILEPICDSYDYILVDCPANAGILTGSALAAADQVLIPFAVDYLAFESLGWFLEVIKQVKQTSNPSLRVAGIFFTMFDSRTRHTRKIIESAYQTYGPEFPFFATNIRYSVSFRDASLASQSILSYAPKSAAADSYRSLAQELEEGVRVTSTNEIFFAMNCGDDALAQGDFSTAYAQYCRATELYPELAPAWTGRAESAPDWEEKVRCYCRALTLEPDNENTRSNLGSCLTGELMSSVSTHGLITSAYNLETIGEKDLAQRIYEYVAEANPGNAQAWLGRARTTTNFKDAIAFAQRCVDLDPRDKSAQDGLAYAKERASKESTRLVNSGLEEARAGNREAARTLFAQAADLDPRNDSAWLEQARIADDFQTASLLAKRAMDLNPRNEDAHELYTLLYEGEDAPAFLLPSSRGWVLPLLIVALLALALVIIFIVQLHLF